MRLVRVIPVLLLLLTAAACSSVESGTEAALNRVATAAHASEDAQTVRFTMVAETDEDTGFGRQVIDGAIDFENQLVQLDMELGLGASTRTIIDHNTMYMDASFFAALFPDSGAPEWFSMNVDDLWSEMMAGAPGAIRATDYFACLKANGAVIDEVGSDEIDGVATTHYAVVLDPSTTDGFDDLFGNVIGKVTVDVWIDDADLIRRTVQVSETDLGSGSTTRTVTTDYFDYGAPVDIELPDPDTVVDFEDFLLDSGIGYEDPFDGADCYGDKLSSCLLPNPELGTLYGDPAECEGEVARVCLVPLGYVRKDVVEAILDFHRETAGIDIVVLPSLPIDPSNVDFEASQGIAEPIFGQAIEEYAISDHGPSTYIGLTSIDLRPDDGEFGWYFGYRTGWDGYGHINGMFSYFRMANVQPYDGSPLDDALLFERVSKYMGRYVSMLHLKWPPANDINYLNYVDMYGFSDLDSLQPNWPEGTPPCAGDGPIVCIAPDGLYFDDAFEDDIRAVLPRLEEATGMRVELRNHGGAYPTYDPWSDEYRNDLYHYMTPLIENPDILVVGVTDDPFADDWDLNVATNPHITKAWPAETLVVASGFDAGTPGTPEHQERLFRVLLRAIRLGQGEPESSDPASLLYEGATKPADLDSVSVGTD